MVCEENIFLCPFPFLFLSFPHSHSSSFLLESGKGNPGGTRSTSYYHWASVLTDVCCLNGCVNDLSDTLKSPFPFQLFISGQSAWMGHITLLCPCGWMLKSLFLSLGFYGWLASSVINQGGLRFSTEVRQNHSQKKLEWVYFLF